MGLSAFTDCGWAVFDCNPAVQAWVDHVAPVAQSIAQAPDRNPDWVRHQGTWYVGVNALHNGPDGRVAGGPALAGPGLAMMQRLYGPLPLEQAQISVIYRGYPKQDVGESDANHRFRKIRDAAHVDGLLPVGPDRRRKLQEPHAFVLGIPLNATPAGAAPLVVWEGSHQIMAAAFSDAFAAVPKADHAALDLTEIYQAARKCCFQDCERVEVHVPVGACYAVHRMALHGVAPWPDDLTGPAEGRMIAYFRPETSGGIDDWLRLRP